MFRTCSPKDFKSSLNGLLFSDLNMIKSEYDKIRTHVYMYVFLISISKLSLALKVIKYRMMSFIYFIAVEYYMS